MSRYAEFTKIYQKKGNAPVESKLCVNLLAITVCEPWTDTESKIKVGWYAYVIRMPYDQLKAMITEAELSDKVGMSHHVEFATIKMTKDEPPVEGKASINLHGIITCEPCSDTETKIRVPHYSYVVRMPYNQVKAMIDEVAKK